MLYELPRAAGLEPPPDWPAGIGGVPASLPDGTSVRIPVQQGVSCLVVGTTGSGKTVYTKAAARALLDASPEMLGVFFQIKPDDFTASFFSRGDKIVTYSPSSVPDAAAFKWNIIAELRQSRDRDAALKQLGNCLFQHLLEDSRNRVWAGAARDTFIAFLRVIVECYRDSPPNGKVVAALRGMGTRALLQYLSKCPRNHSLLRKSFDFDPAHPNAAYTPPRKAADILFFLNDILESYFGGNFASPDGTDTIADFLCGRSGARNLFFLHDLSQEEASRPFELYFLRKIIEDKMSPSANIKAPVLMVLDEADKIGGDFGLAKAATLGRGYGLQLTVSTQSLESLFSLSPQENRDHTTNSVLAGFPMIVAFHGGDPATIATLQTLFGSRRKEVPVLSLSRYDPIRVKSELEPTVSDSDFASLNIGECYVKIQAHPVRKVKIASTAS